MVSNKRRRHEKYLKTRTALKIIITIVKKFIHNGLIFGDYFNTIVLLLNQDYPSKPLIRALNDTLEVIGE